VLTLARAHLLEGAFVPKKVLARLDGECKLRIERLVGLQRLGLFDWSHGKTFATLNGVVLY
jgi:hypothetical protein